MTAQRIIVDGYNVIHASEELSKLADKNLEAARERLVAILTDYCARQDCDLELVFDAARTSSGVSTEQRPGGLTVTFTASGQTADSYIESLAYSVADTQGLRSTVSAVVVTGDYNEQKIAGGAGLLLKSSREFLADVREAERETRETARRKGPPRWKVSVGKRIPDDVRKQLESLKDKKQEDG